MVKIGTAGIVLDRPIERFETLSSPSQVCLQGIGKHWKRSIAASDSSSLTVENSYGLSQKTDPWWICLCFKLQDNSMPACDDIISVSLIS